MNKRKQWWIIAYDIRSQRRLQRTHYYLKKEAVALQRSVFLAQKTAAELKELIAQLKQRINIQEDDVRLYPISSPHSIWMAGKQGERLENLYAGRKKLEKKKKDSFLQSILKNVFGKS